jgi:hypothetical protein
VGIELLPSASWPASSQLNLPTKLTKEFASGAETTSLEDLGHIEGRFSTPLMGLLLNIRACSPREPLRERQAQPERIDPAHPELVVGRAFPTGIGYWRGHSALKLRADRALAICT